jgi:peptide-methionine (R)-S-oxide reductase
MFLSGEDREGTGSAIGRRVFLAGMGAAAFALAFSHFDKRDEMSAEAAPAGPPKIVTIVEFSDAGSRKNAVNVAMIVKSDADWRKQLSADQFEITRRAGTERPYSGDNLDVHVKGVFRCICCDTALFDAATKFESGTGWPSFWAPIAKENVWETRDISFGIVRTEVSCRLCAAHLGHVFDDGPPLTGLRYCMNSLALRFAKAT